MSWLVESLILDRETLKANPNFEDDNYNNLLILEWKIKELFKKGVIEHFELAILDYVSTNKSYYELEELLGISRQVISKYFSGICDKISYSLGGVFTDDGYLEYMRENYNLSDQDIEKLREHMTSTYKHTIRRKGNGR